LRSLEETLLKGATHNLTVRTRVEVALYLLNQKRAHLRGLEERFRITVVVSADPAIGGQVPFLVEKGEQVHSLEEAKALAAQAAPVIPAVIPMAADEEPFAPKASEAALQEAVASDADDIETEDEDEGPEEELLPAQASGERAPRKRRRRRRGRHGVESPIEAPSQSEPIPISPELSGEATAENELLEASGESDTIDETAATVEATGDSNGERRRRRRGRRGGRRNRRERPEPASPVELDVYEPELARAVSNLDFAPQPSFELPPYSDVEVHAREAQPPAQQEQPAPAGAEPVIETAAAEPARRRSTVREPAPVGSPVGSSGEEHATLHDAAPAPPSAQPVVSPPAESANQDQPRRSGWWSKRVLGRH